MTNPRIVNVAAGCVTGGAIVCAFLLSHAPRARATLEQLVIFIEASAVSNLIWFAVAQVAVAACGILPAAIVAVMAGAIYGIWQGMLLSSVCTMLGGWLAFLLSRSFLRPVIARLMKRHSAFSCFDQSVGQEGWRLVCLLRVSPIMPFAATSYGLGLTNITQRDFLLGTIASLPSLFGYVALGAFGMEGFVLGVNNAGPIQWVLLAIGTLSVLWAVVRVGRAMRSKLAADPA